MQDMLARQRGQGLPLYDLEAPACQHHVRQSGHWQGHVAVSKRTQEGLGKRDCMSACWGTLGDNSNYLRKSANVEMSQMISKLSTLATV